jgi:tetratricopeptide (TPR) repeat protein
LLSESEAIWRELGNASGLAGVLNNRAYAELLAGDHAAAEPLLRESLALNPENLEVFNLNLGLAVLAAGRLDEARAAFSDALSRGIAAKVPDTVFYAVEGLASTAASAGDDATAARLWGASEAMRESIGAVLAPAELALHEQLVRQSRKRLGVEGFTATWAEGKAMPIDRAVEVALANRAPRSTA